MRALTPRLSVDRLLLAEVSLLIAIELLNIPSPTTASPFRSPQFGTSPGSVTVRAVPPTDCCKQPDLAIIIGPFTRDQGFANC
jgi:hypothetical protein